MLIVIDLSTKLTGLNLFESFLYNLKSEQKLAFINIKTNKISSINYNEIKENILNILYENHISSFSICLLTDMAYQEIDPLKYSNSAYIYNIKKTIIEPLKETFIFNNFYYFSLDTIKKDTNLVPLNELIKIAIDFNFKGYISKSINHEYSKILFTQDDFTKLDKTFDTELLSLTYKERKIKLKEILTTIFNEKISLINDKYPIFDWYKEKLNKVLSNLLIDEYLDSLTISSHISESLKKYLKLFVSTYSEEATIIRLDLNDESNLYNKEIANYRNQLKLIALIIYLSSNNTNLIFENNNFIEKENHWEIKTILNEQMLSKMLKLYTLNLQKELSKINNFNDNKIDYQEFSYQNLNFLMEMKKIPLPASPKISLFYQIKELSNIEKFKDKLYERYILGIEYANNRINEITSKLRIQKDTIIEGKNKQITILEMNTEIANMKKKETELQQKILFYKPVESYIENEEIKIKQNTIFEEIKDLIDKKLHKDIYLSILCLIIISSSFICLFLNLDNLSNHLKILTISIIMIIPSLIYTIIEFLNQLSLKNKIKNKILYLQNYNESVVNNLFNNDKDMALYVENIYNLIMLKKYIKECELKVESANKLFELYNYQIINLNKHIETIRKLIEILNLNNTIEEYILESKDIENLKSLDIYKNYLTNPIYSPTNYLLNEKNITNKVIVNNEKIIDLNSNTLGFIDKFIINYDKEYNHE